MIEHSEERRKSLAEEDYDDSPWDAGEMDRLREESADSLDHYGER